MKDITKLLNTNALKPKERLLLLVQNDIAKETTGSEILTPADKHALGEGWKPASNYEAVEYNKYNQGWNTALSARLDAQTKYLSAEISLYRALALMGYLGHIRTGYKADILGIDEDEALQYLLQHSGLPYDRVVYALAFHNLSESERSDILALYPDAQTESDYLTQEELLAELFDGSKSLTTEAKQKLVTAVVDDLYNRYAGAFKKVGLESHQWYFEGYFADLPHKAILHKWAEYANISAKDDDTLLKQFESFTEKNHEDAQSVLRRTVLRWLGDGLFLDEYAPLCRSTEKNTCNDSQTKLPHKKVLSAWLRTKDDASKTLRSLIAAGHLKLEDRIHTVWGITENVETLTGESTYNCPIDLPFVSEYKAQIDALRPVGAFLVYLHSQSFLQEYASLLAFQDIFAKLSRIYEVDAGQRINTFIADIEKRVRLLNTQVRNSIDTSIESLHEHHTFIINVADTIEISLSSIEPGTGETETHYQTEFAKLFGSEW
jgi:hypothetical protein